MMRHSRSKYLCTYVMSSMLLREIARVASIAAVRRGKKAGTHIIFGRRQDIFDRDVDTQVIAYESVPLF
jgi:hypothetical protein